MQSKRATRCGVHGQPHTLIMCSAPPIPLLLLRPAFVGWSRVQRVCLKRIERVVKVLERARWGHSGPSGQSST